MRSVVGHEVRWRISEQLSHLTVDVRYEIRCRMSVEKLSVRLDVGSEIRRQISISIQKRCQAWDEMSGKR